MANVIMRVLDHLFTEYKRYRGESILEAGESEPPKPEEMPTFGTAAFYSICIAHRQSTPIGLLDQHNMQGDPDEDMPDMNEEGPIDPPADRCGLDRPALGDPSASNPD
jgi:hypothetical protein